VLPHQGPREPLQKKRLTEEQQHKIALAIGILDDVQANIHVGVGDSVERTTVCKALEKLYPLTSPHRGGHHAR
jgi:hypothetical protein